MDHRPRGGLQLLGHLQLSCQRGHVALPQVFGHRQGVEVEGDLRKNGGFYWGFYWGFNGILWGFNGIIWDLMGSNGIFANIGETYGGFYRINITGFFTTDFFWEIMEQTMVFREHFWMIFRGFTMLNHDETMMEPWARSDIPG